MALREFLKMERLTTTLDCGEPVPECIGIAWRPALSLLASHDSALNTRLIVAHFGSDRRFSRGESWPSGIRFVPGDSIRFHGGFHSSKVVAKLQKSLVLSSGYTCYENQESSCRLGSISADGC
jgi:hypothetical protein